MTEVIRDSSSIGNEKMKNTRSRLLHLIITVPEGSDFNPKVAANWGGQWTNLHQLVKQKRRMSLMNTLSTSMDVANMPSSTSSTINSSNPSSTSTSSGAAATSTTTASLPMTDALLQSIATKHLPMVKAGRKQLPPGLYLGFLQLRSVFSDMELFASKSHPSILPFVKLRNLSHVSKDEWELVQSWGREKTFATKNQRLRDFQTELTEGLDKLLKDVLQFPILDGGGGGGVEGGGGRGARELDQPRTPTSLRYA